jgi:hypothetical protein
MNVEHQLEPMILQQVKIAMMAIYGSTRNAFHDISTPKDERYQD